MNQADDAAQLFVVRYRPDPRRDEPVNVGLVARTPAGWITKFAGVKDDDVTAPGWAQRLTSDAYADWVDYYRRSASDDQWVSVSRLASSRLTHFVVRNYGTASADRDEDWTHVVDRVFREIVDRAQPDEKHTSSGKERHVARAESVLRRAGVLFEKDVEVPAVFRGYEQVVPFRFRIEGGTPCLVETLWASTTETLAARSRELMSRMAGAREAGSSKNFLVMTSRLAARGPDFDAAVAAAETEADVIDTDDDVMAVARVQDRLAVA